MPKGRSKDELADILDDVSTVEESEKEKAPKIVWERRDDISPIVSSLIQQFPDQLHHIQPSRIAYAGFSKKKSKVLAFVKSIKGAYNLFMNQDYVLAVYLENWIQKSPAEKRLLILHELLHIPDGGFDHRHKNHRKVVDHDIKDFAFVIRNYGVYWEDAEKILPAKESKSDAD